MVDVVVGATNIKDRDAITENSRIFELVKGQLSKLSGIISKELPKAKQRLVREVLNGIQVGKDIKLSSMPGRRHVIGDKRLSFHGLQDA